jgi:hypothetical protein
MEGVVPVSALLDRMPRTMDRPLAGTVKEVSNFAGFEFRAALNTNIF